MATLQAFQAMSDALLPYLAIPPILPPSEQRAYLVASLEFAYTAVELVEEQLETNLRAAQAGLESAATAEEVLAMERRLVEEQRKMDEMKAQLRVETARAIRAKHRPRRTDTT
ncbi:hypothetical protein LshimejAT787_1200640 [Lyophyllum shimeji]|uniref:Uncharacterized protein n=1 Tax=Lyophyllum shimeji TaxID=47721 RepID=A0A9P3PTL4_LYOSH|nr:hypothetical protein LshimejAT787_1200640 [Lyophyllum shimeji]